MIIILSNYLIIIDISIITFFLGQEIDFLTLLQSFGVDMGSVAHALGVDINTLINMDKDVLMHLLTSHSSSGNN